MTLLTLAFGYHDAEVAIRGGTLAAVPELLRRAGARVVRTTDATGARQANVLLNHPGRFAVAYQDGSWTHIHDLEYVIAARCDL